jgi:hypothetical protein
VLLRLLLLLLLLLLLFTQPALQKLGVKLDAGTAQAIMSRQRGAAPKVLYEVKQALAELEKNAGVGGCRSAGAGGLH